MATNFEPHKCLIFLQSTKIDTHENKAFHSNNSWNYWHTYIINLLTESVCLIFPEL